MRIPVLLSRLNWRQLLKERKLEEARLAKLKVDRKRKAKPNDERIQGIYVSKKL